MRVVDGHFQEGRRALNQGVAQLSFQRHRLGQGGNRAGVARLVRLARLARLVRLVRLCKLRRRHRLARP